MKRKPVYEITDNQSLRLRDYYKCTRLCERYFLLTREERNEVKRLVRDYGYTVNMAIQNAYFFGVDKHPYDYRRKMPTGW